MQNPHRKEGVVSSSSADSLIPLQVLSCLLWRVVLEKVCGYVWTGTGKKKVRLVPIMVPRAGTDFRGCSAICSPRGPSFLSGSPQDSCWDLLWQLEWGREEDDRVTSHPMHHCGAWGGFSNWLLVLRNCLT